MEPKTLKSLEYDKILDMLKGYCQSSSAKNLAGSLLPTSDIEEVRALLSETAEADKVLYDFSVDPNFAIDDVSAALSRAEVLSTLSMGDLIKIARVLKVAREVRTSVEKVQNIPHLTDVLGGIFVNKAFEDDVSKAILSETEMNDNASPELRSIRQKIRRINDNIRSKLNEYVTSPVYGKYLQDNIITVRGDRYVIPVRAECRGNVSGIVHDQSASGQTVYVEPQQIVEMNNDLKTQLLSEAAEIEKILREFTFRVSTDAVGIRRNFDIVTRLDVIFAKAKLARGQKAVMPEVNDKGYLSVKKGRHPLISKEKVRPITVYLGKDFDILLVTGPNTGGKTVTLKLTGLFVLMAMTGLFLPAEDAEIPMFDEIYSDIGDEQSIEQNLSTFSGHMKNITEIVRKMTAKSLLLLDELGAGTDPSEGAVLAVAITKYIKETGAKAVITSHYNELKEFSFTTDRVENASMDFDPKTFSPTYNLTIGVAGASNALYIAQKLGLPEGILSDARSMLSADTKEFNHILLSAERQRRKAEELTEKAKEQKTQADKELKEAINERNQLKVQAEKLNENLRKETKKLIDSSVEEAEDIIEEMKRLLLKSDEKALFEARKLKKKLENMSADYVDETPFENDFKVEGKIESDSEIKPGDVVFYKKINSNCIVQSVGKNDLTVKVGNMSMKVKASDCNKVKVFKTATAPRQKSVKTEANTETFKNEINLLGKNVDEAVYLVDEFLDAAKAHNMEEVRIIHGKGTGALRAGIQKHLKTHPLVAEFRLGLYGEGESGVTIVKLK